MTPLRMMKTKRIFKNNGGIVAMDCKKNGKEGVPRKPLFCTNDPISLLQSSQQFAWVVQNRGLQETLKIKAF